MHLYTKYYTNKTIHIVKFHLLLILLLSLFSFSFFIWLYFDMIMRWNGVMLFLIYFVDLAMSFLRSHIIIVKIHCARHMAWNFQSFLFHTQKSSFLTLSYKMSMWCLHGRSYIWLQYNFPCDVDIFLPIKQLRVRILISLSFHDKQWRMINLLDSIK